MSRVAWIPERELEHPEWLAAGRRLGAIGRCSQWWIGDWIRYGTARWGEKYAQAAKVTGYDPKSLRNLAYVASRFDLSRRRDTLSWSHHAELAVLEPGEQDRWLELASAKRLSVADLRIELRTSRRLAEDQTIVRSDQSAVDRSITCPYCGKVISLTKSGD